MDMFGIEALLASRKDNGVINALLLTRSNMVTNELLNVFKPFPWMKLEVQLLSAPGPLALLLGTSVPDLIFVDLGSGSPEQLALVRSLWGGLGASFVPIVAMLERGSDLGAVRAVHAGANDVLLRPINIEEARKVIERVLQLPKTGSEGHSALGKTVSFVHVSGGAGATTLAVNAAFALARDEKKDDSCLIDLDVQFGIAGSLLDLARSSRIEDIVADPGRLDREMLESLMVQHKTGLKVLTAPRDPIPVNALSDEAVTRIVQLAKRRFAFSVIDLPVTVTSWTESVLRSSDVIYLVVEASVPAAHRARRFLELLQTEGMGRLPVKVVVNRHRGGFSKGNDVSMSQFGKAIKQKIDYVIPNDYKLISLSHGVGRAAVSIRPKSAFSRSLQAMLATDLGIEIGVKRRGLFGMGRK